MDILQAIELAQGCYVDAPAHETATCNWVILPLLHASGYVPREIVPQLKDQQRKLPDYTILPGTPYTWFVEAKAWHIALEDDQVIQALNYANHNGRRWVVLSNGKLWRLYDNRIEGVASEKLVAQVLLEDTPGMCDLLSGLSKTAVLSGGLATYADRMLEQRRQRDRTAKIGDALATGLLKSDSPVILAIAAALAAQLNLENVGGQEVVDYFGRRESTSGIAPRIPLPSEATVDSSSEFRDRLAQLCQQLILSSPGLTVDRSLTYWTTFVADTWKQIPRVPVGWSTRGNVVQIWVGVERDRVKLVVEIGPGPQDVRQKAYAYAKAHPELFNPGSSKLYPMYSRIYRRDLVSFKQFATGDFEVIERSVRTKWAEFLAGDFPKLEQAMVTALLKGQPGV